MHKVAIKYLIVKFRNKVSFTAFQKRMTIEELFMRKIIRSYHDLVKRKDITSKMSQSKVDFLFKEVLNSRFGISF